MSSDPFASVRIDADEMARYAESQRRFWQDVRERELPGAFADAAETVAEEAKRDVGEWSTRIPDTIRHGAWKRTVGNRTVGYVKAGSAGRTRADGTLSGGAHAGLYEYGSKGSAGKYIRRPLFGNRNRWYNTPTRPFLLRAVETREEQILRMIDAGIDRARARAGL